MALGSDQSAHRFVRQLSPVSISTATIVLLAAMLASGCADNSESAAMAARCKDEDRAACAKIDDERQVRDAADYQVEPALGYLTLPPGIFLPMPVAAHSHADPSM